MRNVSPRFASRVVANTGTAGRDETANDEGPHSLGASIPDLEFRCPSDLAVTHTPLKRLMVIGSCLVGPWGDLFSRMEGGCEVDHFLLNNAASLPAAPPHPISDYNFHLLQIPLSNVLPEAAHMRLSHGSPESFQRLFEKARERLVLCLDAMMQWNRDTGVLTFVCNFLVPQQNAMGRLLPRYDLRNMVYFVEKLNEALADELKRFRNAYLFDFNELVGTFGRRSFQDDMAWNTSHASALSDFDWEMDQGRIDPIEKMSSYYPLRTGEFIFLAWRELIGMYRTIIQADQVKLVLVDLDDTIWRGVLAEGAEIDPSASQGWPRGFIEALLILKRRGVLLGIVSKNDEARAAEILHQVHRDLITLDDFAVRRINWRPKADNIEEILNEINLLPRSVVFIDDNPTERASVKAAFPEMRVIGENPYLWRRILLWSPETQVPVITEESNARTTMVQAQIEREQHRKRLTRGEFLASLAVRVSLTEVTSMAHPDFPRLLELINKTNQFNTTGQRRSARECGDILQNGGCIWSMRVSDRYTEYGIVGAILVEDSRISQFVMSCRVIGLDVEIAAVSMLLQELKAKLQSDVTATITETDANAPSRDLWRTCGFLEQDGVYVHPRSFPDVPQPAHVEVEINRVQGVVPGSRLEGARHDPATGSKAEPPRQAPVAAAPIHPSQNPGAPENDGSVASAVSGMQTPIVQGVGAPQSPNAGQPISAMAFLLATASEPPSNAVPPPPIKPRGILRWLQRN